MGTTFTSQDEPDLTIPEDSIVRARLIEIKPREINWNDKVTGEAKSTTLLEWWWQVTEGEYETRRVKGECPAKLSTHPSNKLSNWSGVLLEREIPAGFELDLDDLIGLTADIHVGHRPDKKDVAKVWEFVADVLPSSGAFSTEPPF